MCRPAVMVPCVVALAFAGCTEDFDAAFAGSATGGLGGTTGGSGGTTGGAAGEAGGTGGTTGGTGGTTGGMGGTTGGMGGTTGGTGGTTGGAAGDVGGAGGATGGAGGATGGAAGDVGGAGGATGGSGGTVGESGRVYYSPPDSADLFVYDPNTDAWSEKSPSPLDTQAMTAHGGFLYAKSTHSNVAFYQYTPSTDSWVNRSHAPSGSSLPAHLAASESHVYYFANDKDVYQYNPSSDSWGTVADMPLDRGQSDSFEYANGYIYHLSSSSRTLRRYEVASNAWSDVLATFPSTTYGIQDLQDVGGFLYAVSGLASAHVYDPSTQAIEVEWLAPAQVMSFDAASGVVYVWSGLGGGGSKFRRCDLAAQSSVELSPPPSAIYGRAWAYIP